MKIVIESIELSDTIGGMKERNPKPKGAKKMKNGFKNGEKWNMAALSTEIWNRGHTIHCLEVQHCLNRFRVLLPQGGYLMDYQCDSETQRRITKELD